MSSTKPRTPTQTTLVVGDGIPAAYRERFEKQSLCMAPAFLRNSPSSVPATILVVIAYGTLQRADERVLYEIATARSLTCRSAQTLVMLVELTCAYKELRPNASHEIRWSEKKQKQ